MKTRSSLIALLVGVALWLCCAVYGQGMAQLTGRVTDPSGAIVPGASVTVTNADTGVKWETSANEEGYYILGALPPGPYSVTVRSDGFRTFTRSGVVLETGFKRTIDVQLVLGNVAENVTVTAQTPLIEAESSSAGQLIERATIMNMPLSDRRAAQLVRLSGSVVGDGTSFAIAGGRKANQMWRLDGTSVQRSTIYNPVISVNPPAESVQEFKVELNNYSAEYGRSGGGQIVMTSRSGTNQYRGAVYEFLRNEKLDTRTFFAAGKGPLRYNVFGGSFGGPIVRDRTFFFFNYEGSRQRTVSTRSATVPHVPEVSGDFSNRTDLKVIDPLTGQQFANNIIPGPRLDPVGREVAKLYPAPNTGSGNIRVAPGSNYISTVANRSDSNFYTVKIDHNFGPMDRAYVRLVRQGSISVSPAVLATMFPNTNDGWLFDGTANWTHQFSPTMLNQFYYGYGYKVANNATGAVDSGVDGRIGLKGTKPEMLSRFQVPGHQALGESELKIPRDITHNLINSVSWVRGKHHLKTGFEYRFGMAPARRVGTANFAFNQRVTRSGLAELLLGRVASAGNADTYDIFGRVDNYATYIQDDWKVSGTLTLNLGLRWELDTPRRDMRNQLSGFAFDPINPVCNCPGAMTFAEVDGFTYASDFDKNNFGPRIGFAWRTPFGDMVVRGGYGVHYNPLYFGGGEGAMRFGYTVGAASFASVDSGVTPAFLLRDGLPPIPPGEPRTAGYGAVPIGNSPRFSPQYAQRDHVAGYMQQWNFNIQKMIPGNTLVELAYLGNAAHKLGGESTNHNVIPLVNGRGPAKADRSLLPFPQYAQVTQFQPPWGNSSYHAMNVKAEKRYSAGLNFLVNYTWSKFLDDLTSNQDLGGDSGGDGGYTHPARRSLDKSLSGNDIRHRFIGSGVYDLPFGQGRRWRVSNGVLRQIVGGWGLGFIVEMRTGTPWSIGEDENRTNTFAGGLRPNVLRDPRLSGDRELQDKLARWFDTTAFAPPGVGEFGNAARNYPGSPGLILVDTSIHKAWNIGEHRRFLFRGDFYNLPNHANFARPNGTRGAGAFGKVSNTVGTGRQIQLSLRFEF